MGKICDRNNREKMKKRFNRNLKAFNIALIFTVVVSLFLVSFAPALSDTNYNDTGNIGTLLMKVVVGHAYKCNSGPASGGSVSVSSSLGSRSGTVLSAAGTSISVSITLTDADGNFSGSKSGTVGSGTVTDVGTVTLDPTTLVASASGLPLSGDAPLSVDFTGSATGGCKPYTWAWNFDGDGSSSLQSPTHVFNTPGTYNCVLTVTDDCSNPNDSPTVTITVNPVNTPPPTPSTPTGTTSGMHGTSYSYNTVAVVDPDGDIVEYRFDWDDGSMSSWSTSTSASHTWTTVGTFDVKVRARDEHDAMSGWSSALSIDMGNTIPPAPGTPSGTTSGHHGTSYSYSVSPVVDPEGDTVEYRFDWGDSSMSSWSTSTSASHTWTDVNTFSVKAQSRDDWGESSWSSGLSVSMDNQAPNTPSTPSGPTSGYVGTSYTYSTSSTDPDGDTLQYYFDWDGSNSGWISSSTSHSWSSTGTYFVTVKCRDSFLAESSFSSPLTVTINIHPLEADAHGPYSGNVGIPVQMIGSATGGQSPYSYLWNFGDGESSTQQNPQHAYDGPGEYTIILTVHDSVSDSDIDYTSCTIYTSDPPVAFANGPYEGEVGEEIEFDGDVSGGTAPYTFFWEFGDGNTSDEQNPVHIYETPGEYIANFSVVDDYDIESNIDNATVTILEPNDPPNKPDTPTGPASGKAGDQYTYTSTGTDPDGDDLEFFFDWGDGSNSGWVGPIASGGTANASHTWDDQDDYSIKVKAKDPNGEESPWSDPLPITMPNALSFNLPVFIQYLLELFPFLGRIFFALFL